VVHSLHFLGIAAFHAGNIIELARARVGVEEACSGVRSLVSCIFAGLFFSASLVARPWARAVLILLAPLLALAMNFLRSLALTLMVNRGIGIEGFWHDLTGFAVLGLTAAMLGALALALGREAKPAAKKDPPGPGPAPASRENPAGSFRILAVFLALAAVLLAFFWGNTRPFRERPGGPPPDLLAILPDSAPGWQVATSTDLYRFRDILQTDLLAQRIYRRGFGTDATEIILYLAYWRPGQAPVSLVASHTPDACWPGAGWTPQAMPAAAGPDGPPSGAEGRLFTSAGFPQYVWFWHLYAGRPIAYQDPYSLRKLLGIAWRYGFRHNGDQLFVRLSSNRPWPDIAGQQPVRQFLTRLQPLGL
jgi:exosortase/archaeosortase family protein